jgi:mono/diheme cytochrome c family protein
VIKRRSSLNAFSALGIGLSAACLALACGNSEDNPTEETPPEEPIPAEVDECEVNPYLRDCPGFEEPEEPSGTGGTGGTSAGPEPEPPGPGDLAKAAAENILKSKCGACHGSQLSDLTAEAGMNFIDDIDKLAEEEKIIPLNSASSPIIRRMRDGSMPKGGPRMAEADIAVVASFIDNPDYWPNVPQQVCDNNPPLSFDRLYEDVARDLSRADDRDKPFLRYISLGNRAGAGECTNTAMDLERQGLTKLINSLSIDPDVFVPEALDEEQTLFKVDIRKLQWDREINFNGQVFADVWEAIAQNNPYAVPFVGEEADDAREDALTDFPVMFLDSMTNTAAIGNLYYAIVDIDVTQTLDDFVLNVLDIDVAANLEEEELIRAGTTKSRISKQDRLVEGHEIGARAGVYYQSFDFNDDQNESIFQNPFGFNEGGREAIFTLPNGLLAYAIADDAGNFVEDSDILLDTQQGNFRAVTMVSCANCHVAGLIPVIDEVKAVVRRNAVNLIQDGTLNQDQLEQLSNVYLDPDEFKAQVEAESNRFYLTALRDADLPVSGTEQISTVFLRFDRDMTLGDAAGDLGVSRDELDRELNNLDPVLGVLDGGTIDRDDFTAQYVESLCILSAVNDNRPDDAICADILAGN